MRFVDENSRAERHAQKQAALRAQLGEKKLTGLESHFKSDAEEDISDSSSVVTCRSTPGLNDFQQNQITPGMSLLAFKDDIQICFTTSKIFSGTAKTVNWLLLGYNEQNFEISSHALRALSNAFFGRMNHIPQFEEDGRRHYTKALRALSSALNSEQALTLPVMTGGMIASCYEMIASPTYVDTLSHAGGIGRLMELRGPERHCSFMELHLFTSMRSAVALKALVDKKRTFLEREEWKITPWRLHPESKDLTSYIVDVLCDLPGLLQDFDELESTNLTFKQRALRQQKLAADINHHLKLIYDWRVIWEKTNATSCTEQPAKFEGSPFETVLQYEVLEEANGLMIYNAIMLRLARLGRDLLGPLYDHTAPAPAAMKNWNATNIALHEPGASLYDSAVEILRSVEYHLSPPHDSAGAYFIVFPLRIAWDTLPEGTVEHDWVKTMLQVIAERSGFLFSTGMLE